MKGAALAVAGLALFIGATIVRVNVEAFKGFYTLVALTAGLMVGWGIGMWQTEREKRARR